LGVEPGEEENMSVGVNSGRLAAAERELALGPDPEVVGRATELVPLLRKHAGEGQEDRCLASIVTDAMEEAGLFRLMIPQRFGGLEVNVRTFIEVLAELGRGDGSTAWTAALLNTCTWFATTYGERAQEEIWGANPDAKVAGIFFPGIAERVPGEGTKVEGGYRLTGRYDYASGSFIADWATLGMAITLDDGSEGLALGLVPSSDWRIEDTWYTLGMRGTGSNTVIVEDVFVPEHRVQLFEDMAVGNYATEFGDKEPNSRAAFLPVGTIILAAPHLGIGRAALESVLEKVPGRPVSYTSYTEARNSPTHQLAIAEAMSKVDAAYLLAARSCRDIDRAAFDGDYPDDLERARIRMDTGHIVRLVRQALDLLLTANGAGSFAEVSSLGRMWRDANTAGRHAFATTEIGKEIYGRLLLGADGGLTTNV
jgi:alkylation response protein AidB-like acyl-CoA dehydrogenase